MKRKLILGLSAISATLLMAFTNDILKKLALSEQEAKEVIFDNFIQADLYFPRTSTIKNLALGKREEAVRELGSYIRSYTQTPEFDLQYQQARTAAKPQGPEDANTLLKNRIAELETNIIQAEEDLKKTSGDMKKLHEFSVKTMKEELKALKDPKDPKHQTYREQAGDMSGFDSENYQMHLKEFEKNFPPAASQLIRNRLQAFLHLTQDINFNAALIEKNGKKVFADPKLEAKDALWKRCFRAGPETINAARKFAQEWLASLKMN